MTEPERMNVIAVMGRSKSGKDTVGQMAKAIFGDSVVTLAFADKLKEVCMDVYGLSWEDVYTEEGKAKDTAFICWKCPNCKSIDCFTEGHGHAMRVVCRLCTVVGEPGAFTSKWTNRMILQHIGTEGFRRVDPFVWVNHALRVAKDKLTRTMNVGVPVEPKKLVVITDCRFRSEYDGVVRAGGAVWRLRRPETDRVAQGLAQHASENEMDTIPDSLFQRVIVNDGTLDQLQGRVKESIEDFMARRI